ncbi:unnamed protein product, partial [Owenia fusiformis]
MADAAHGKKGTVVLFKAAKDGTDQYVQELEAIGLNAVCIPVLRFTMRNLEILERALKCPELYSGMILTSQRAVESIQVLIQANVEDWNSTYRERWRSLPVFVVGGATCDAAEKLGFSTQGRDSGNSEALLTIIMTGLKDKSKPLLFPCGNLRKETIPKSLTEAGIPFKDVCVYETTADPNIESRLSALLQEQDIPDFMVFYSPSGVTYTHDIFNKLNFPIAKTK